MKVEISISMNAAASRKVLSGTSKSHFLRVLSTHHYLSPLPAILQLSMS